MKTVIPKNVGNSFCRYIKFSSDILILSNSEKMVCVSTVVQVQIPMF